MPFYEYTCSKCGHHHEELQKVSDPPLRKCPECGKNSLTRLISAPVFRLKGGGWYETDFKSDQEAKRNLAGEKEPAAKSDEAAKPAAETKAETPAAKAADKPSGKTTVAVKKPAAKAPAKKPAARKPAARKSAGGKRR
ncbi:MAG: zinc ribbon domain-containing protein [Steroidobacteraceae bacterium]|jgi:putative FmdB family regulatory protein|nr:zinc ribbon domain-containing protein [Steroidobacteraceae bacterium]